ncbi:MAG: GTPase Era [Peptococcaceae bacterium]|nr:GTPase Era [Peptococcaceae bacterium]
MGYKSGFVSIIGRPNVGKSSLMNHILKQKIAISSDKPQTTRQKILGLYTTEEMQIVFTDTPGIHKPKHKLGEYMVGEATAAMEDVDVILYLIDGTSTFGSGEQFIINQIKDRKCPVFLLINKIDLLSAGDILPIIDLYKDKMDFREIIPISAVAGTNVDRLLNLIQEYLPEGPQYYPEDMVTDQPERAIIAELIREKVLYLTREEVPHAVAVEVTAVQARENGNFYVEAVIYVERDSQKGIIIGKKGQMLRDIGSKARVDIEDLLEGKVFLELRVKVRSDWRDNEISLRNFGFDHRK